MMNLFSRLSELLDFGSNEPWEKGKDLDRVFAENEHNMDKDLMRVRHYAVAVVALERSLARELKLNRARAEFWSRKAREFRVAGKERLVQQALILKKELDEVVRRLEIETGAALRNRERVERTLHTVETWIVEVRRQQRSILARHRAALARSALHRGQALKRSDAHAVGRRLHHLLDELARFREELMVQAEADEDLQMPD